MSKIKPNEQFYVFAVFFKMLEIQNTMLDGLFKQKVKQMFNAMQISVSRFMHSYDKHLDSEGALDYLEDDAHFFIDVFSEAAKVPEEDREAWIQMLSEIKPIKL